MLVTATGNLTLISLLGNSGSSYIGLDNVSVTVAVPGPVVGAGLAGLALGWFALLFYLRHRITNSHRRPKQKKRSGDRLNRRPFISILVYFLGAVVVVVPLGLAAPLVAVLATQD